MVAVEHLAAAGVGGVPGGGSGDAVGMVAEAAVAPQQQQGVAGRVLRGLLQGVPLLLGPLYYYYYMRVITK